MTQGRAGDVYDDVASSYDGYRRWWLAIAGFAAERRLRHEIAGVLRPGVRVLDAGAGTGAVTRAVLEREPTAHVAMIDLSSAMLAHAPAGAGRVRGDVAVLPFATGSFDVVTAGWVLETVPDPMATMRELLRVLQPDGFLLAAFSATPRHLARLWRPLDRVLRTEFSGHFLSPDETPFHACATSRLWWPRLTPAASMRLGRCCLEGLTVDAPTSDARAISREQPGGATASAARR